MPPAETTQLKLRPDLPACPEHPSRGRSRRRTTTGGEGNMAAAGQLQPCCKQPCWKLNVLTQAWVVAAFLFLLPPAAARPSAPDPAALLAWGRQEGSFSWWPLLQHVRLQFQLQLQLPDAFHPLHPPASSCLLCWMAGMGGRQPGGGAGAGAMLGQEPLS